MKRVLEPLSLFGARMGAARGRDCLPLTLTGARAARADRHTTCTVPSAQVKSAMLLAALNVPGRTTIVERAPTRDHTERMLRAFGAKIAVEELANGEAISVTGEAELKPARDRGAGRSRRRRRFRWWRR